MALKFFFPFTRNFMTAGDIIESATREVAALKLIHEKLKKEQTQYFSVIYDHFVIEKNSMNYIQLQTMLSKESVVLPDEKYTDSFLRLAQEIPRLYVIVMRLEENVYTFKTIRDQRFEGFTEYDMLRICRNLWRAIDYLHDLQIYHLDIHMNNVFIAKKDSGRLRDIIIDFGHACSTEPGSEITCENSRRAKESVSFLTDEELSALDGENLFLMLLTLITIKYNSRLDEMPKLTSLFEDVFDYTKTADERAVEAEFRMKDLEREAKERGETLLLSKLLIKANE